MPRGKKQILFFGIFRSATAKASNFLKLARLHDCPFLSVFLCEIMFVYHFQAD